MNKTLISSILILAIIFILSIGNSFAQTIPGLSVKTNKKSYKPGSSGVITIKFKTGTGIKIPKEPPIDVNISGDGISGDGLQDYSGGDGDYIDSKTIKYNFTVSGDAESDTSIKISGSVKFGYCSSESGVCKIGTKNFSVTIKVQ